MAEMGLFIAVNNLYDFRIILLLMAPVSYYTFTYAANPDCIFRYPVCIYHFPARVYFHHFLSAHHAIQCSLWLG